MASQPLWALALFHVFAQIPRRPPFILANSYLNSEALMKGHVFEKAFPDPAISLPGAAETLLCLGCLATLGTSVSTHHIASQLFTEISILIIKGMYWAEVLLVPGTLRGMIEILSSADMSKGPTVNQGLSSLLDDQGKFKNFKFDGDTRK